MTYVLLRRYVHRNNPTNWAVFPWSSGRRFAPAVAHTPRSLSLIR